MAFTVAAPDEVTVMVQLLLAETLASAEMLLPEERVQR